MIKQVKYTCPYSSSQKTIDVDCSDTETYENDCPKPVGEDLPVWGKIFENGGTPYHEIM